MSPKFSVVIPTYNRRLLAEAAINSALVLTTITDAEIVVVDDASRDGTGEFVRTRYAAEIERGILVLRSVETNVGCCAAKNMGAEVARGEWVIFLDSDDTLRSEALVQMVAEVDACRGAPFLFFRCQRKGHEDLVQVTRATGPVELRDLLEPPGFGECLPVVRRAVAATVPFPEDLRGSEGLAYMRMIHRFGSGVLSDVVARIYDDEGTDRLSAPRAIRARGWDLARYHFRVLLEFGRYRGFRINVRAVVAIAYHLFNFLRATVADRFRRR